MSLFMCTLNREQCSRCGETTLQHVDVQGDGAGRKWMLWRCERCQFEKTAPLLRPASRDSRTVIC
jgi:hypothetical protein